MPLYESPLKNSGFHYSMKFDGPVENARRNRNRKPIWFNLPHSLNVNTNIDKIFIKLVRTYFPRSYKFNRIFNLNTIKIIYSSLPNAKSINSIISIISIIRRFRAKNKTKYNGHVTELKKIFL